MIPGQDLGVRLQAFLGWIGNYGHLPYEKQQEMLWDLGQIEIGVGTLVTTNQRVEQAIEPSVSELGAWVQQEQPNVHVDETPWSVLGLKEWLWVIAHPQFCLFQAADTPTSVDRPCHLTNHSCPVGIVFTGDFGHPSVAARCPHTCR